MMHLLVLLIALISPATAALPVWGLGAAAVQGSEVLELVFALLPASPAALGLAFDRVTTPDSPDFRAYLSRSEIANLVAPSPVSVAALRAWISAEFPSSGEQALSVHGDLLSVKATAKEVSAAFGIRLAVHEHPEAPSQVRSADPTLGPRSVLPPALREHVSACFGVASDLLPVRPSPRRSSAVVGEGKEPGDTVTPAVIFQQYDMSAAAVGGKTPTSQGVAAFEDAQFYQSDVDAFQKANELPSVSLSVLGPNDGGYFGEAGLDTQYITAAGRGVPTWFLSQEQFDMLAFCELVLNMTAPPAVVSISWGSGESNYAAEHLASGSACFQKMGLAGISVLAASGDAGTGSTGIFGCKAFDVTWPASCPFVTAVGGTYLESGQEHGWSGSGGGFSSTFARPSYQDKAVSAYLAGGAALPSSALYNSSGRALPDVAAMATNYQVFSAGSAGGGTLTGTSAATPVFAGLISVINDARVAQKKPTLGFLNPVLWAAGAQGFGFDVTDGNNKKSGCPAGFEAASGWDPVVGHGTPSFTKLEAVLSP